MSLYKTGMPGGMPSELEKVSFERSLGSPKARRGKQISKPTKAIYELMQEKAYRYEIFLSNSEIENNETIFAEKGTIVIDLFEDAFGLKELFDMKERLKLANKLKEIAIEAFTLNEFTDDEDIDEIYHLILDELEKTGLEYSVNINTPGKLFPSAINRIPRNYFYYNLTCSYKMKDSEPFTYISEKAKTRFDFFVETNKAYNDGFFDINENPNMIYLSIWNRIEGQDKEDKETLFPTYKKSGKPNRDFIEAMEILRDSDFTKFESKYLKKSSFPF